MSIVSNQGEDYEEDVVDEEYDEEGDEDTDSKLNTLFGIPVKFLIIGVAALLLVIIIVIVFALRGSKEEEIWTPDMSQSQGTVTPTIEPSAPVATVAPQSGEASTASEEPGLYIWLDGNGNKVGISEYIKEGATVTKDDVEVGVISMTSGTPVTSDTGVNAFFLQKALADFGSTETTENDINTELRKLGYTGDEIAAAQASGADLNAMVESARALRDEEAKEALIRMSDSASEEFRHMAEFSIFSLPYQEFPETENSFDRINRTSSYVVNADYWKLETYGNQLIVKLKIANNSYAFMSVKPERWSELPDTGNMVVRVDYALYGMATTTVQMYITNLEELNVAEITVNPEDSATDLSDIINVEAVLNGG